MKPSRWITVGAILLLVAVIIVLLPGLSREKGLARYIALTPQVWHSGENQAVSLTLWRGDQLASSNVEIALLREGEEVFRTEGSVAGKGRIEFLVPDLATGEYELRIKGEEFEDQGRIRIDESLLVFLETDKPIYKPGQEVHIRILALDSELKPLSQAVTIEIMDAKGIKIFRKTVSTDEYGMATLDLPLSEEPNLGVWKIVAEAGGVSNQLDIRVEEYVLPRYEIDVELREEWFLVNEPITGRIKAEYSFGKPVDGELEVRASRYVGQWEEYAVFSGAIPGEAEFEIPAVGYVAGVPAAGGMGNVVLDITVTEGGTGYQEKTNRLLTVSSTGLNIQIIPESSIFKPSLPFDFLIITETPNNQPREETVTVRITYGDQDFQEKGKEVKSIRTQQGKALVRITPPEGSVVLYIEAVSGGSSAFQTMQAGYSPSGNFIHVEQVSQGIPRAGEEVRFLVYSTREATNFYYEVVSRGRVVFTDFTPESEFSFITTPAMAPSSRLLVYQVMPNSEVAADFVPFQVEAGYPHSVEAAFSKEEARPGEEIELTVQTEGEAKVGIAVVDRSVFILAENRLNLQQVFAELERLYMQPQIEVHPSSVLATQGAKETFAEAGVVVLSNQRIPEGKDYQREGGFWEGVVDFFGGLVRGRGEALPLAGLERAAEESAGGAQLAEVERVRQYFPETWLWQETIIDSSGRASLPVTTPDTITTWQLRVVALSREKGLGIAEELLTVFQPFFAEIDLPYSAIRGEELPVQVAMYNYLGEAQEVQVEIETGDWFELIGEAIRTVEVAANAVGSVTFTIRPAEIGIGDIKVTVRSQDAADALIKTLLVEPEGVERTAADNFILSAGNATTVNTAIPESAVEGSGRAYIAVTSSLLSQTIEGLDNLLQMPYGCGEQNMILFAPDVFITKYLRESGQLKPEIMAQAEKLMVTGYQRELTYMRSDGSFSAFGESDSEGSLWLTAFVLKTFAQAKGLIYLDETILDKAGSWIISHQNNDGSFDAVGFVAHQEMVGGISGKTALTAYVAIALQEAGEENSRAVEYLESRLEAIDDPYTMALVAYALELAGSEKRDQAYSRLMEFATEDEKGLHWGEPGENMTRGESSSTEVEATAYAALALLHHGDNLNTSRAARWLVSQRNASGGFASTQDTVVALQALTEFAEESGREVDLRVSLEAEGVSKEFTLGEENFDVLQLVEVPVNAEVQITAQGTGEAIVQVVRKFNLPQPEEEEQPLSIRVDYDTAQVEVDDQVAVSVEIDFASWAPMETGMVVLDISVPTGFAPVAESLERVIARDSRFKRYDIAGRKIIFYLDNLSPGEGISFSFKVQALYPVKAKGVSSQVYSYYQPELRGETLSQEISVSD